MPSIATAPIKLPKSLVLLAVAIHLLFIVIPLRSSTTIFSKVNPFPGVLVTGFQLERRSSCSFSFTRRTKQSVGRGTGTRISASGAILIGQHANANAKTSGIVGNGGSSSSSSREQHHCLSMVLGGPPMEDYYDRDDEFEENNNNPRASRKTSDFQTALAIVPPLEDWDRLQRARHYARDPVFREWPPAIRLFHPFDKSPDIAFDIAQLIEDLEIEAFDVTLDSWVIVPNVEATKKEWEDYKFLPDVVDGGTLDSYYGRLSQESEMEVQDLIKSEERKGKIKAVKKNANAMIARQKSQEENDDEDSSAAAAFPSSSSGGTTRRRKSPAQLRDEQQKSIEEDFGGPCVLCLEPDEESKEKLMELREMLLEGLGIESYSSPSSLYAWDFVEDMDMGYRPLIPISKFDTFHSGMEKARRLKGLWGEPLTINVKCLDILSCKTPEDLDMDDNDREEWDMPINNRFTQQASQVEIKKEAWACNAKIMLVGEEIQQNDTANEKMITDLLELGEIGGADISMDFTILEDEDESTTNLEKWLDEDDEFDEGTQVVIGRTYFFTGDQRNYKGMPATSVVDAKDRSLGEAGAVSGLARRRGSTSRKQNVWEDGEYGRRSKDFLPWSLRERKEKEKYRWNIKEDNM